MSDLIKPGRFAEPEHIMAPPHSMEAEQSVLGGLLIDNLASDQICDQITGSDFYRFEHREIFNAISTLIAASKPADMITVFEQLQSTGKAEACGGLSYLNSLAQSVPSASNIRRYAEIVKAWAVRRALRTATRSAADIANGAGDVDADIESVCDLFTRLQRDQTVSTPSQLFDVAMGVFDDYERMEQGETVPAWQTNIPALNDLIVGLVAGDLYIIAARPSVGKSSFAQWLALWLAQAGHVVLFLSLEMGKKQVGERAISALGRVRLTELKAGRLDQDEFSRAAEAADQIKRMSFAVDDQPALTLAQIRSKARATKGLKVLVIDYLQLCSGSTDGARGGRQANRNAEIEEISRGLKALAKDLGIAVVALSQLNRQVETRNVKRPVLADLRDSGSIEQDADAVIFLWPVRELQSGHKLIGCAVEKNRDGPCGEFALDFDGKVQRWAESTASIAPAVDASRRTSGGFD